MNGSQRRDKWITIVLFLLPSTVGLVVISFIPIVYSFLISLTTWDGLNVWNLAAGVPKFVGFGNYHAILAGEEFWRVLRNTLYYIVLYIPLILIASIGAAILLNNRYRGISVYRVLYFIPVLTSWVAGSLIWKWLLSRDYGPVNALLGYIGIEGPAWLQDRYWAMPGIVLASVWKDLGFFALIFLGGLQGISPSYYEAAEIDGAGFWQKLRRITLPLLSPFLFFVMIICIINSFQLFPQVMIMTTDAGPAGATQAMVERIYKYAFKYYKMGYASSFSWILFAIIFLFTYVQMKLQKRWVHYDA
ncbi:MAG: sugar ABC transporter permease [Paenibacillaceae bacterium]|uniref:carbohydrate ABC transporter permease n=1 Tax=Paenibacillus cymbidii TaxID=1639034 RepID=UPI0010806376|nr:sugar ABC transporter permease [Paenibacillus cymbidii]MBO9605698.1 sugar ABC transporter permease [Paenibacillaceae bacterium]